MGADLVGANYPTFNPIDSILGQPRNLTQANIGARTNWLGQPLVDTTGVFGTAQTTFVTVPVAPGDVITSVIFMVGATAASTPTHFALGLYSGVLTTTKLLGTQSTDTTTTAIAANTLFTTKLGAVYTIQPADCPYGYLFVGVGYTGTASPSCLGWTGPAHQESYVSSSPFVNTPLLCAEQGTGAGGSLTASVTLATSTIQAATPAVWLV